MTDQLPSPVVDAGWPSACLPAPDLNASTRFYRAIGFEVLDDHSEVGVRTVLRAGPFRLGLFRDETEPLLNWRGADVPALRRALRASFPALDGTWVGGGDADGPDGVGAWFTRDPGGNPVLLDSRSDELGPDARRRRVAELLADVGRELDRLRADDACRDVFRREVLERFGPDADRPADSTSDTRSNS